METIIKKETYFDALIALQNEIKNPTNSESGYQDRYRYTPLDKLLDDIKPILSKHRFVLRYFGTKESVGAKLIHESGEVESSEIYLPRLDDAQKLGSYITYLRRYQTLMLLGIMGKDEDDDGLATTSKQAQKSSQNAPISNLTEQVELAGVMYQHRKGTAKNGKYFDGYFPVDDDKAKIYWNVAEFQVARSKWLRENNDMDNIDVPDINF